MAATVGDALPVPNLQVLLVPLDPRVNMEKDPPNAELANGAGRGSEVSLRGLREGSGQEHVKGGPERTPHQALENLHSEGGDPPAWRTKLSEDPKSGLPPSGRASGLGQQFRGEEGATLAGLRGEPGQVEREIIASHHAGNWKGKQKSLGEDTVCVEMEGCLKTSCSQESKGPHEFCCPFQGFCHQRLQPDEQLLADLPPKTQSWPKEHGPEISTQTVTLAEEFLLRQPERQVDPRGLEMVMLPGPEKPPSDTWRWQLSREIHQEDDKMTIISLDKTLGRKEEKQPEKSEDMVAYWVFLGRAEHNSPDQGDISGNLQGNCLKKEGCRLTHPWAGNGKPDENTVQEGIFKDHRKRTHVQRGKVFRPKCSLTVHTKAHKGEKPYECSECGRTFRQVSHLLRHKRIHTGEKPYQCTDCRKSFTRRPGLISHQRTHTGDKPYRCAECGKSFTCNSRLIIHGRIHSGDKPYRCPECGKSFNDSSNFIVHQRTHTGKTPYTWAECSKSFSRSSRLLAHMRQHTGKKML